jgi:hypothetical protein
MDLEGGGTWIAASDRGLCLCLLNLNLDPAPELPRRGRSRGLVIPELIDSADPRVALNRLSGLDLGRFAPFRLVAIGSDRGIGEARWDRDDLSVTWHSGAPICFASSGLGDDLVLPRLDLFEEMVVASGAAPGRQDAFHRHRWPGRPEISVLMSREDARTVSLTTLEVDREGSGATPARVCMRYETVPEAVAAPAQSLARTLFR